MRHIITISREYGSGGRIIGKKVADTLGFAYYDKEIIDMAAQESGLAAEFIEKTEQNISSGWLYNLLLGSSYAVGTAGAPPGTGNPILPLADQVFNAERKTILRLAQQGSCVIVGRCADYILSTDPSINNNELLNVFVYAPLRERIKRAVAHYTIPEQDASKLIIQIDKRRANHYNTFTENTWGDRRHYDLMVNSSLLGLDRTAELIVESAQKA